MDRQDKSEDSAEWACSVRANACDADSRGNLRHRAFCSLWGYFNWFNGHEQLPQRNSDFGWSRPD